MFSRAKLSVPAAEENAAKRGTNHAELVFFTCITKNRLGADKCTGMYAREEDVLSAVYYQLNSTSITTLLPRSIYAGNTTPGFHH